MLSSFEYMECKLSLPWVPSAKFQSTRWNRKLSPSKEEVHFLLMAKTEIIAIEPCHLNKDLIQCKNKQLSLAVSYNIKRKKRKTSFCLPDNEKIYSFNLFLSFYFFLLHFVFCSLFLSINFLSIFFLSSFSFLQSSRLNWNIDGLNQ